MKVRKGGGGLVMENMYWTYKLSISGCLSHTCMKIESFETFYRRLRVYYFWNNKYISVVKIMFCNSTLENNLQFVFSQSKTWTTLFKNLKKIQKGPHAWGCSMFYTIDKGNVWKRFFVKTNERTRRIFDLSWIEPLLYECFSWLNHSYIRHWIKKCYHECFTWMNHSYMYIRHWRNATMNVFSCIVVICLIKIRKKNIEQHSFKCFSNV